MARDRQQDILENIIHDEDHDSNLRKLNGLYGLVARRQNEAIRNCCAGVSALDVGAGYGNLTRQLKDAGLQCTGIEIDSEKIQLAQQWFGVELEDRDIYANGYADGQFDTVIFREVLRHLRMEQAIKNAVRIAAKRIIIFQANPIWLLRLVYRVTGHHEHAQYSLDDIAQALKDAGLNVRKIAYMDTVAFPLSGGYIGRQMVPAWRWFYTLVLAADEALGWLVRFLGVGRWVCYRGLILADKSLDE